MRKTIVAAMSALLLAAIAAPAHASSSPLGASISVSFADLNIHNEAGAKVLYARLQRASASVCELDTFRELGSLARVADAESCYAETLDKAVTRIDSDALKKIHSS
ncbi:MAG: UrcA family protein [Woeseiaceae bacterium]|nr:UrcA family protein [Woeseiaceae bacterium]